MNKLKEQMNVEVKRVINKYNSAVFVLNGGSFTKAIELYGFKCPSKTLRAMCIKANEKGYTKLVQQDKNKREWVSSYDGEVHPYFKDVSVKDLRENKHLFIGDAE
jgi:bisphosphoglycerate-dependent phosphoglycerate mutase